MAYDALPRPVRIKNGYGPTESTTFACCHTIDPDGLEGVENISIGRPIGNTRAYVFDVHGQPVPPGVAGELYLGGDGLARGYLNRPEATAERFVIHHDIGERLYRTGDRVRWRGDGTLEFLGRIDDQVKLRGFRIEPGEIETALCRHPAVHQAVVLVREDRPGDRRLAAYVVTTGESGELDEHELRAHLARTLPEYMIPAAFTCLRTLPLNANGKVDRRALPAPRLDPSDRETDHVPPRDELETLLASVWQEVLGVARIGIHDDFFQLGGHSLMAVRLLARIDADLGVKLPISTVIRAGTIERMAMRVKRLSGSRSTVAGADEADVDDPVVTLQPHGVEPPVFVLPGLRAHVISLRDLGLLIGGNERPVHGLQPTNHDLSLLQYPTIEELATALIKDMRRIASRGPYHLLGFSAGGSIAYEIAQQLSRDGETVGLLGLLDTSGPGFGNLLPLNARLVQHFQMLRVLGARDRLDYTLARGHAILRRFDRLSRSAVRRLPIRKSPPPPPPAAPVETRSWANVLARYRHRPYCGRVDLFAAEKRDMLGLDVNDPTMGWGSVVKGEIKVHRITGDHLEIIRPPAVNELASQIRACLTDP